MITPDGHSFCEECIIKWIEEDYREPITRHPIKKINLYRNISLEQLIDLYHNLS